MASRFTLRGPRVVKGIRHRPASKQALEKGAAVLSLDDFMLLQEEGGKKRPLQGQHVAVPQPAVSRNSRGGVRRKETPKALGLGQKGSRAFLLYKNGHTLIARRIRRRVDGVRPVRNGNSVRTTRV